MASVRRCRRACLRWQRFDSRVLRLDPNHVLSAGAERAYGRKGNAMITNMRKRMRSEGIIIASRKRETS